MEKWRTWMIGIYLISTAGGVWADSLDQQRQRYANIKQAWDHKQMDRVKRIMPTLQDYPLYPYLQYRMLVRQNTQDTLLAIKNFIQQYPTLPPVTSLFSHFINVLANRQDWQGVLSLSKEAPKPVQARCNWYYAKWATGQQQKAFEGAKQIWPRGTVLPHDCKKLFSVWQASKQISPITILLRIQLAMKAGNDRLINCLVKKLPANYQTIANAVTMLQQNPQIVISFASTMGPTDFTRTATHYAFTRVARKNVESARLMIPQLVQAQKMSLTEEQSLKETAVWCMISTDNLTSEQARWRDNIIMNSESTPLIERRIRLALNKNDRLGLNTWIAHLPVDARKKDAWQYWQADLLISQGRKKEAEKILHKLMKERGFYPMVAAQRLGEVYSLQTNETPKPDSSVEQGAELVRARELMYWGLDNLALREWINLISSKTQVQKQMLARYAKDQEWWDLSVQTTITAKMWNNLEERFPLAWHSFYKRYTSDKDIPLSYAMAISRQESAWNPKARSPVGASGLMQIIPATAIHIVKMYNIRGYTNSSQLLDPQTNIQIGTQYLEYVYQQFGQNRILASVAYNAGPSRAYSWLNTSGGKLDAVAFIESIPFFETRVYVKKVLIYDAYYSQCLGKPNKILNNNEWNHRY